MDPRGQLSRFAALGELPAGQLAALAAGFVEREVGDGEALIRLGQRASSAFLILEGELSVTVESDGLERELARLGPGNLVGHIALFDGAPASATCRAVGRVRVGELGRAAFGLLTGARAELAYAFQRAVAEQVARDYRSLMSRAGGAQGPAGVDSVQWRRASIPG